MTDELNEYTIVLSDAELKSLEYVAIDANSWIQNAIHERCRLAMEELVSDYIKQQLESGGSISGTKEEMVMASTLPSAKERHDAVIEQISKGPAAPQFL